MINWISATNPPKEFSVVKEYIVTVKYDGTGNVNGRMAMVMTYQEKGKKKFLRGVGMTEFQHGKFYIGQSCQNHVKSKWIAVSIWRNEVK